jgi:hypothetical protein
MLEDSKLDRRMQECLQAIVNLSRRRDLILNLAFYLPLAFIGGLAVVVDADK